MNIAELWERGNYHLFYGGRFEEACELLILLAVALGAFACGRLSVIDTSISPVAIENAFVLEADVQTRTTSASSSPSNTVVKTPEEGRVASPSVQAGSVVVSKNGEKYHHPWCSGARAIKEENKIWFTSEADALAAGYTKAGNCK